jgi:hypothetical protein
VAIRVRRTLEVAIVASAAACAVDIADFTTTDGGGSADSRADAPMHLDASKAHPDAKSLPPPDAGKRADATRDAADAGAHRDVHEEPDVHRAGDASADADAGCTPGVQGTFGACGMCGTLQKTCTPAGVWGDPECMTQGVCVASSTQMVPCGNCGQATEVCQPDCTWGAAGGCNNQGLCAPGDIMCDNFSGSGSLVFSCIGAATCGSAYATCDACLGHGAFWDWYACDNTCQWNGTCNPSCQSTDPFCSY